MKIVIVNSHLSRYIGGSELQCHLIGNELTARGHDVHYLAVGGAADLSEARYQVHSVPRSGRAIGMMCRELRPEIVYWRFNKRSFHSAAGLIAKAKIPIVFSVSHVADTEKWSSKLTHGDGGLLASMRVMKDSVLSRWNYRGFGFVDGIVVNNNNHLGLLSGPRQIYIPNSVPLSIVGEDELISWPRPYCLWVSNIKPQKQPEKYVELAETLASSGVDFLMVGQVQSRRYRYLTDNSIWPTNFYYLGALGIGSVNQLVKRCLVLVHTCRPEGFPNIFIQAWSHGKPVASLCFDPNGVLQGERVGYCSGSVNQLAKDVERLIRDEELRNEIGKRGKAFSCREFDLKRNVDALEGFMADISASYR